MLLLGVSLTGCAPSASKDLVVPAQADNQRFVSCAERSVNRLAAKDDRWDSRITHRDPAGGTLETGDFPTENESGFRVRVTRDPGKSSAHVRVKGAGAYFTDLGVDAAAEAFADTLEQCLAQR